jgi:hypothetical protein
MFDRLKLIGDLKRVILGYDGDIIYMLERLPRLEKVAEAIKAMKENLICDRLEDGTIVHQWYTVAPCEYGEAVDDALAALEAE